jgi:translation initiation factor 2 alpha subunit (eIF-2alpha)
MSSQSPYIPALQAMLRKVFQRDQLSETEWQVVEADLFRRAGTSYEQLAEKIEHGIHSGYDLEFQLETIGDILEAGEFGAL